MARVFFQPSFSARSGRLIASAFGRFTALGVMAGICLAISEDGACAFNTLRNGNLSSRGSSGSAGRDFPDGDCGDDGGVSSHGDQRPRPSTRKPPTTVRSRPCRRFRAAQASARATAINGANNLGLKPASVRRRRFRMCPMAWRSGAWCPGRRELIRPTRARWRTPFPSRQTEMGPGRSLLPSTAPSRFRPVFPGRAQITASGTGVVGTVTSGETVTPLTGGVATSVAPGSTVSITQAGRIDRHLCQRFGGRPRDVLHLQLHFDRVCSRAGIVVGRRRADAIDLRDGPDQRHHHTDETAGACELADF